MTMATPRRSGARAAAPRSGGATRPNSPNATFSHPQDDIGTTEVTDSTMAASRALMGIVTRSLTGVLEQITLPQWRVLVLLSTRGPLRSGVVAELLGVHPSTFTRTADRLVAAGLVSRTDNPGSRREVIIDLAAAGRRMVDDATARRRAEMDSVLAGLTVRQRTQVLQGMRIFADAAGEPVPEDLAGLGI